MDCSWFSSTLRGRRLAIALGALLVACGGALALSQMSHAADPVPGVQADFKWTPAVAVMGQSVTFESTSQATGLANAIADYRWDIDGDPDNGYETGWGGTPAISATYTERGGVDVRLQVRDTFDNRSTLKKTITVAGHAPIASYTFAPAAPRVNDPVAFTSTAGDPDGTLASLLWDLNGDGVYDNGAGPTALRTFSAAGSYVVGLQVTDNDGAVSFFSQSIPVAPAAPGPAIGGLRLMSPFPVVRIAGRTSRHGVRLKLLSVDAPAGSTVQVRCKGRSCPFRSSVRAASVVRMRGLERRLKAGVKVRIYVLSSSAIGKYTVFKIRKGQSPLRSDACLMPDSHRPIACPAA